MDRIPVIKENINRWF